MTVQTRSSFQGRNPDILTCIANLSNDEVFTPPEFANQMLDQLAIAWAADNDGAIIWTNPTVTFLDPFSKSGVFLREITSRLIDGLATEIPDLEERVDHILTKQVFGIAITQLTALLTRRTLYCSKWANGKYSVVRSFDAPAGNVWFQKTEHEWTGATTYVETSDADGEPIRVGTNGKCRYCGATQKNLDRGNELETHAYAFIHTDNIRARLAELFGDNMQFDVIIGNPPYQLNTDGHGTQARPIYQHFVEQAKALNPRLLSMIIPARWFSGGMGLDDFRESMLGDCRIRSIDDYLTASDVFPGVGLKGGVCYFLWDRDHSGDCRVTTRYPSGKVSSATRPLLEEGLDIFIRFNEGLSILRKVIEVETGQDRRLELPQDQQFAQLVSSIGVYGLDTTFRGSPEGRPGDLKVYRNGGTGFIDREEVTKEIDTFDKWKVFVGAAAPGTGNRDTYPHRILSTPFLGEPGSISSWTYLLVGPFDRKEQAESVLSYMQCRLTRLLILLRKPSQHTTRKVYGFVPIQDWIRPWTDADLYEKYGITDDEIAFIESLVRPLESRDV